MNLYKDNSLQIMHEKLKNQQLDTWEQLQNAILKEKEARIKSVKKQTKELMKTNLEKVSETIESGQVPTHHLAKDSQKCRTFLPEGPNDEMGMDSDIEYITETKTFTPNPLAKEGQKCRTFLPGEPNDDIDMDFDIEYDTDPKMLKPNPRKERVKKIHSSRSNPIDYNFFYQFDANAISCRHCPYHRPAQKRFKPTRALKNHLKTNHLTVLEQYLRSNNI
ncbi:hypothetical protein niasHT_034938 [Heterodera trifolii]|uniref:BED-type domain-containing protein n=1 Tax=Heterodera trifolii TaxID=157864 RepID=A0ABD2I5Q2_9BILA